MKILAIDTATKSLSVAVVSDDRLLVEVTLNIDQTHSKHLMRIIAEVLRRPGLEVADLDGLAVTCGPGSFTGLRIGISCVKGLALAAGKPLVGVSSLDALADPVAQSPHLICPLLDARKSEVYFALYRHDGRGLRKEQSDQVASIEKVITAIDEPCLFIGNGAVLYQEMLQQNMGQRARFASAGLNTIKASTVAWLSAQRFARQDTDDIVTFKPQYIRKPDAELKLCNTIALG